MATQCVSGVHFSFTKSDDIPGDTVVLCAVALVWAAASCVCDTAIVAALCCRAMVQAGGLVLWFQGF